MSSPLPSEHARYDAALRFLYERINYERFASIPYRTRELKLDRMRELLARLGSPEQGLPIVHVAGTKGKGSTAAMIAAVLTAAGYRTGLFTSPHLDRVEERMAMDGIACPPADLVGLLDRVVPVVVAMDREAAARDPDEGGPTYFEITTAMALLHFADHRARAAVLEVGLGGRLDSTNVCLPVVSVITSISFDHTEQLGNTLALIAREKAGIIKPGVPVVSGVSEASAAEVIRGVCRDLGSPQIQLGEDFSFQYRPPHDVDAAPARGTVDFYYGSAGLTLEYRGVELGLLGRHQGANAAVALATLAQLQAGGWRIPEKAVRRGLAELRWPARVELVCRRPAIVIDAAHNVASVEALVQALDESFAPSRRFLIFATTQDKDIPGMLSRLLPRFDHVVLTRYLDNPRAVPVENLSATALALTGRPYPAFATPAEAWKHVRAMASPEDLVCITGSFFIAAQLRQAIVAHPFGGTE